MKLARPALLSSLALVACLAAQASDAPSDTPQPAAPTESGMVGGINPRTGALRTLTDAEIRALSDKANTMTSSRSANQNAAWARMPQTAADASRTFRRHAHGTTSAQLPLSAMSTLTVKRAADGSLSLLENNSPLGHGEQEVSK